ncbi:hypothetical protein [Aquimarina brevivitae]|uniref:Uncharacterized protein n=1 Tax=Aquimarina brevivitae TaxID=323412 RepID=A0A4Q7PJI0_9FLAO|nr:hypothetical protein [Aquimarina brevivitae]RZT00209.1 hypothetical protein EV197_1445 [Aquimarina brevivitae]
MRLIKILFTLLMLSNTKGLLAQDTLTLKKGIVVNSLSQASSDNTYSLYLPENFTVDKKWPLLIGIESTPNSAALAHVFKEAANEYGYVIAILNTDQKDSLESTAVEFVNFLGYIVAYFSIQQDRVYTIGEGLDAELSSLVPVLYPDNFAGTIAVNNSIVYDETYKPKKNFYYYGIVHPQRKEFSYFIRLNELLTQRAIPAEVAVYDSDFDFPPTQVTRQVLSRLTLQAMFKGRTKLDSIWIKKALKEDLNRVNKMLRNKEYVYAQDQIVEIKQNYLDFYPKDSLATIEKNILNSKDYKEELSSFTQALYEEELLTVNYLNYIKKDLTAINYQNLDWWRAEIAKLDTFIQEEDKHWRNMAIRIKLFLKDAVEAYNEENLEQNIEAKIFSNMFITLLDPKDFDSHKKVIGFCAMDGDYETALGFLQKLLANGYDDFESLYEIEGTTALKMTKEYNQIIKKHFGITRYSLYKQ